MAIKFFQRLFGSPAKEVDVNVMLDSISSQIAIRELAYQLCVLRVAKALARCNFSVASKSKGTGKNLQYALSVSPNPNQTAGEFWEQVAQKLYYEQDVLILRTGGWVNEEFYVADSFSVDDTKVMKPWKFKDITIGNLALKKEYDTTNAVYLTLKNGDVKRLLDQTTCMYGELFKYAMNAYRNSNGTKLKLKIGRIAESREGFEDELQTMLQEDIKKFLENPNAAFPEFDGYDLQKLESSGAYRGTTSRDISALLKDVLSITSKAFLMPENIALGDVADTSNAVNDFLTFCLGPLVKEIEQGLNRVVFGKEGYSKGEHIKISMATVTHKDILSASASIDKLIGCGVATINDIMRLFDEEQIPEEYADKRFMTKNYSDIEIMDQLESVEQKPPEQPAPEQPEPENRIRCYGGVFRGKEET